MNQLLLSAALLLGSAPDPVEIPVPNDMASMSAKLSEMSSAQISRQRRSNMSVTSSTPATASSPLPPPELPHRQIIHDARSGLFYVDIHRGTALMYKNYGRVDEMMAAKGKMFDSKKEYSGKLLLTLQELLGSDVPQSMKDAGRRVVITWEAYASLMARAGTEREAKEIDNGPVAAAHNQAVAEYDLEVRLAGY